ncbi:TPA: hypothetical protein MYK51_005929 [Klebsiella variicola subsp. variicola]|nr:hypothetical protein [Klebsiella variicola]HCA9798416.1 hypothetical protein [Klebsiella variicola subsp. variicola]
MPVLSEMSKDPNDEEITESFILLDVNDNPINNYRYRLADSKSELFNHDGTLEFTLGDDKNIIFWLDVDRAERS